MPWTVDYTDTALRELRKLDRRMARRVVEYMDELVTVRDDPRRGGKASTGPIGGLWRYRIGRCGVICDIQDPVLRVRVLRVAGRDRVYR
ncbi:MAG: type II toxin-antitoxin system RelE/ParE family toxin [Chloroflexi bacterium]|nr:type II toxin-antitoxin system RelE/ParE family toxin [Chloroflexota bacterium]